MEARRSILLANPVHVSPTGPIELSPRLASQESGVGLGHRRLSVIDLSVAGRQPMGSDDGMVHIVYNGEIYNFQDIRTTLEGIGHRFQTETDTEVIFKAR